MLTRSEHAFVAANLTSSYHDYFVWGPLSGEPVLRANILCYRSDDAVEIVGVPLGPRGAPSPVPQLLDDVVAGWAADPAVKILHYYGPHPVRPPSRRAWRLVYGCPARASNRDVFIDLRAPLLPARKIKQDVRRARRNGVETTVRRRGALGHEHLLLLTGTGDRVDANIDDAMYFTNIVALLRSPACRVVEARVGRKLVGFAITHSFFPNTPFMIVAAFDRAHPGTSDALYAAVLENYRRKGAAELGLGPATDASLLRYKTKWGTARMLPPVHERIWQRRSHDEPFRESTYWAWRFLMRRWETY